MRPLLIGNWKMNLNVDSSVETALGITRSKSLAKDVECVICPQLAAIYPVAKAVENSGLKVGAQNVFHEPRGAFTGEVSTSMLKGLVDFVIIGHSERRTVFGEQSQSVARKAIAVTDAGMAAVVCVGESGQTRKAGDSHKFIAQQLARSLEGFDGWAKLVVAYEPIWAIGTGVTPTTEQIGEAVECLRTALASLAPQQVNRVRMCYGGSVDPLNIAGLFAVKGIDGMLVGGASLDASKFVAMASALER